MLRRFHKYHPFNLFEFQFRKTISSTTSKNNSILFYINGKRFSIQPSKNSYDSISISMNLSTFIREIVREKSVKIGCEEGGCGACTVLLQEYDQRDGRVMTKSVNSCLTSINVIDGMNVVTLEGLKDNEVMKEIQRKFIEKSATQCGFCTPGFEMTIFERLIEGEGEGEGEGREENLGDVLSGNLCRCTGYRSIFEVLKESVNDCNIIDEDFAMFPEELKEYIVEKKEFIDNNGSKWFTVNSLSQLLDLKKEYKANCRIILGGTELLVLNNLASVEFPVLIHPRGIEEMEGITIDNENMVIGSCCRLSEIDKYCVENNEKNKILKPIHDQLRYFASKHIRNMASLGGNIVNASPTSDLNPIWVALNAKFLLVNSNNERREVLAKDFFIGYKQVDLKDDEVLLSVIIPLVEENEFVSAYKQSKRKDDDLAIITSCMRMKFNDDGKVDDCCFSFGCLSEITIDLPSLQEFLIGKEFNQDTFNKSLEFLKSDIKLDDNAPGGMIEYRKSLAASFYFKFFVELQEKYYNNEFDESAINDFSKVVSNFEQQYEIEERGTCVGKPLSHIYELPQVTGEAKFVDDIPKYENELHGHLVISSVPCGTIKNIDYSESISMEGVKGWVSHEDIPGENEFGVAIMDEELIITKEITSVGQILGVIVAETKDIAKKAASKVVIDVEEKESVLTIDDAIEKDSYFEFNPQLVRGDIEKGNNESENFLEGEIYIGGQDHFYLEPNVSISIPDEDDSYMLISSTQNPTGVQFETSKVIGVPEHKIVVKTKRLGGGFGGKESRAGSIAAVATVCAKKMNAPVRIVLSRQQDHLVTGGRHPFKTNYKVGYNSDGEIKSIDVDLYSNGGYSCDLSYPVMERALYLFDNFYKFENSRVTGYICKTNKPTNTAMRGFGGPQSVFFIEYIIDRVAKELGISPNELRKKHFYQSTDQTPYGMDLEDCQIDNTWNEILEMSNFDERKEKVEEFNKENKYKKRGIYITPLKFGISFAQTFLNQTSALVHVYKDGSVVISHGGVEMGQGLHTKVCQVAGSALGIDISKIQIIETNTDKCANTPPTSASCGSDLNSKATEIACEQINERLQPIKELIDYPENATWEELVNVAFFDRVNLTGQGFYATPGLVNMDWETGKGKPFSYFTYGASCSEVEIDTLTGDHNLLQSDIVFDCGKSLNPKLDIGQVEGAFVQGYGYLMLEELIWGEGDTTWVKLGNLHSNGPGFYKIPTCNNIPHIFNVKLLHTNNPYAVQSSKGVGEPPFLLANSVYFAVRDAVIESRKENNIIGDDLYDFNLYPPCTPEKIKIECNDEFVELFE